VYRTLIRRAFASLVLQAALLAACSTPTLISTAPGGAGGGGTAGDGGEGGQGGETLAGGGAAGEDGLGGRSIPEFPPLEGLPEELAWLDDSEIWTLLPQAEVFHEYCYMRWAKPDRIRFPALAWESCGEGCSRADLLQGHADTLANAIISTTVRDGSAVAYLHASSARHGEGGYDTVTQRIINLESGRTVAALQETSKLGPDGYSPCAASKQASGLQAAAFLRNSETRDSLLLGGMWKPELNEWLWQLPWFPASKLPFDLGYCELAAMEDGGRSIYFCLNGVFGALTPGSSELTLLDDPREAGFKAEHGAAFGDVAAWPELDLKKVGTRIRAWRPDGKGIREMGSVSLDVCGIGVSDTRIAGFSKRTCGPFEPEGRLLVADRTADDKLENIQVGPIFSTSGIGMGGAPAVWGDHVAAIWGAKGYVDPGDRRILLLARTTDWAMRDLRGPDGMEVWEAGLTDQHLYVVFTQTGAKIGQFTAVYRYDLDKFEHIGNPIVPVPDPQ